MIKLPKKYVDSLTDYTFVDLFCGIGGFRLALTSFGAKCVYSIDNDKYASKVYQNNYGEDPFNDITKIDEKRIPNHDILCAGFPCQSFSISGKQKGFDDTRGTLFFEIIRLIKFHNPKIIILENVSHLKRHDNGRTFKIIKTSLINQGYAVYYKVLNSSKYGIPQSRKRIYMVCFRNDLDYVDFEFPKELSLMTSLDDLLLDNEYCEDFFISIEPTFNQDLVNNLPYNNQKPIRVGIVNKGGQGDRIYSSYGHSITLSASSGGTGSKTGLYLVGNKVRKLHPRETARLMGFPDTFKYDQSVTQAHKQFGNSVVIDVLQYIVMEIVNSLIFKEKKQILKSTFNKQNVTSKKGSQIAKHGLWNEDKIIDIFTKYTSSKLAKQWLLNMGYDSNEIISIQVKKLSGFKSDIELVIETVDGIFTEGIQIKLVSNKSGYNQLDKRWVSNYADLWDIPHNIVLVLKYFTGEIKPYKEDVRDNRRMFFNEFNICIQKLILCYFNKNKKLILDGIFKGYKGHEPQWLLIVQKDVSNSLILSIDDIINFHVLNDDFYITKNGNLRLNCITVQRKGGDNGKITSNMLQFKINPSKYFLRYSLD